jgi:hypothetical protein
MGPMQNLDILTHALSVIPLEVQITGPLHVHTRADWSDDHYYHHIHYLVYIASSVKAMFRISAGQQSESCG